MAKQAILDVLENTIGKYVKNLDAQSLNVAVWKGQIELHSLELDISAINSELDRQAAESPNLAVPFRVVSGNFGSFQVDVPWARIMSKPVVLRAQGLNIVVEPYDHSTNVDHLAIDGPGEKKRIVKMEQQRLQSLKSADEYRVQANALRKLATDDLQPEGSGTEQSADASTFSTRLARRIIENLQVDILDVHISLKGCGSAAGVVLASLSLVTTDKDGNRTYVDRTVGGQNQENSFLHKELQIDGLGLYLDEEVTPFTKFMPTFENQVTASHSFILSPLSFEARLRQSDSSKCFDFPKYLITSELSQLSLLLSKNQLELGNKIAIAISPPEMTARPLFPEYRPLSRVSKESAKEWWRYAYRGVGRLTGRQSWLEFLNAFKRRKSYIPLYKRSAHHESCSWLTPLSLEEQAELEKLEHDRSITVEGIMSWRSIADAQVDREQKKFDAVRKKNASTKGGIMAAFFGSKDTSTKSNSEEDDPPITLTVEEMKELEAISLEQAAESDLSNDSKLCDVKFVLGSFKANLVDHRMKQVVALDMGTVTTSFDANADGSYVFDLKLASLAVHDRITVKSLFPTILRNINTAGQQGDPLDDHAFKFCMEKSKKGDQNVVLKLVAFEMVASPVLITEVKRFFVLAHDPIQPALSTRKNPILAQSLSGTVDLFYDATDGASKALFDFNDEAGGGAATGKISDKLSLAMRDAWKSKTQERTKWTIDCDIHAPVVIIPESCNSHQANVLVFDLGHLRFQYGQSDISAKVKDWFSTHSRWNQSDADLELGELGISDLTFTIGKAGDEHWRQQSQEGNPARQRAVVEPISASLDFGIETMRDSDVPCICGFGVVPSVSLSISPSQISKIMSVYVGWEPVLSVLSSHKDDGSASKRQRTAEDDGGDQGITIIEEESHEARIVHNQISPRAATLHPETQPSRASQTGFNDVHNSDKGPGDAFTTLFLAVALQRLSIKVLSDTGQGVEAHLVSVSASSSQLSDGSIQSRLCMGWFWILDRFSYTFPRKQRLIMHSSLPRSASSTSVQDTNDILNELHKQGVFEANYAGSSDLADISYKARGTGKVIVTNDDPFLADEPFGSDVVVDKSLDAKFSSFYLHWNPHAVKVMTHAFSQTIASIGDAYASDSPTTDVTQGSHGRRYSDHSAAFQSKLDSRDGNENGTKEVDATVLSETMLINMELAGLEISLDSARDDDPLFVLTMADTKISMLSSQDEDQNLRATLVLGDVRIVTPATSRTRDDYRTMLGLAPNHSASLLSVQYYKGKKSLRSNRLSNFNTENCDACAEVELSPMRFVYVQAQVMTLVEYVTDGILGALAAQAASSAAEVAIEMVKSGAREQLYSIKAVGFDFILPQSACSEDSLILHAGDLNVTYCGYSSPGGGEAHVSLSDVSIQDSGGDQMVQDPIRLVVDVKLPPDGIGTKDDQAMRIKVNISEVAFLLSGYRYQQIMRTLESNIGEIDPCLRECQNEIDVSDELDPSLLPLHSMNDMSSKQGQASEPIIAITHAGVAASDKQTRMYIDFMVEVLSLELCSTGNADPLVHIAAVKTTIKMGFIPDEEKTAIEATLHNLTCHDRRVKSLGRPFRSLVHQIERTNDEATLQTQDVFNVSYTTFGSSSSEVNLKLGSPQLVFIPDVISEVLEFLTIEPVDRESQRGTPELGRRSDEKVNESIEVNVDDNDLSIEASFVPLVQDPERKNMTLSIATSDCSIVLIDMGNRTIHQGSSISSSQPAAKGCSYVIETVVLQGQLDAQISFATETKSGNVVTADLELHAEGMEVYTAHGRDLASPIQILEPTSLTLFVNWKPGKEFVKEVELRAVTLLPVDITFSMQNAALMNAISTGITECFQPVETSEAIVGITSPLSDVESSRIAKLAIALDESDDVASDESSTHQTSSIADDSTAASKADRADTVSVLTRIKVTFPETRFTFVNDLQGLDEALCRITARNFVAGAEVSQGLVPSQNGDLPETKFDFHVNTSLLADYFDSSVHLWKILLKKPWELTLKSTRGESRRFQSDRMSTTLDIESFPCCISFSERFIVSMSAASQMWSIYTIATTKAVESGHEGHCDDGYISMEASRKRMAATAARNLITSLPYSVENHSGVDVTFALCGGRGGQRPCRSATMQYFRFELPRGEGFGGRRLYGQDIASSKALTLFVNEREIKFDHLDAELSRQRQAHDLGNDRYILSRVTKDGNSTVLHLSSPVEVHNCTSVPFFISVQSHNNSYDVGLCSGHQRDPSQISLSQETIDVNDGMRSKSSRSFGIPVALLVNPDGRSRDWKCEPTVLQISPRIPHVGSSDHCLYGTVVIPPLQQLMLEAATTSRATRRFDVACKQVNSNESLDCNTQAIDPFVVQVYVKVSLVDRNHPFIEVFLEPRVIIGNDMPVGLCVRTPMPHTMKVAQGNRTRNLSDHEPQRGEVIHELAPKECIEVFTPGPSIAICVKCSELPVGGGMTGWMEGGWIDIPLMRDFRLPEPLTCLLPFVHRRVGEQPGPTRGDGNEFFIAEADERLPDLLRDGERAATSDVKKDVDRGSDTGFEVLSPEVDTSQRKVLLTVTNYGVDHTGDILFQRVVETDGSNNRRASALLQSTTRRRSTVESTRTPFSAFSSQSHKRLTLLPDSVTPLRILHLTMEGHEGIRRSQPFRLEEISICEGGVESTAIKWEDNSESGYYAYRRLVSSYQFETHVIPEFVIFNGSTEHMVAIKQQDGPELMIPPGKIAPARSVPNLGLILSMSYADIGGRTSQIRVDTLGFRVSVIKSNDGSALGSIAIQTVIGEADSRLVVKLGDVKFGESSDETLDASKGILENDFVRVRIRWSELQVTLNEARPVDPDDERNVAFFESALDRLMKVTSPSTERKSPFSPSQRTWVEARREQSEEQLEIEKQTQVPVCTIIFRRFTVDWQRIFKHGMPSTSERQNVLLSPERSQLSIVIHNVQIMDNTPNTEFPVVFDSTSSVNFFDLCVRIRGPMQADVVKVDLVDLNLAHANGKSEKILVKTSEQFVWKVLDVADRIAAATAELAGIDLKLEWDEQDGGYIASIADAASDVDGTLDQVSSYTPPRSDMLYDINKARVSPFKVVVTFKRKPQESRYHLLNGGRGASLMNYFTTKLKFTIDRAELGFARYEASHIKGPPDRLLEMVAAVYVSRMKLKVVSLLSAASFQDWKFLASREGGDDEFVDGDILRATGNFAGNTAGYVFKKVGHGIGNGVSAMTSSLGNEIENATDKVGARAVGAGVNSVMSGIGVGVGDTVKGVGAGAGKVFQGAGKGVGQIFGGVTGGAMMVGKGIGKGVTTGDGKAVLSGLAQGASSVGTGVGQGVESAVMGAADGVLSVGHGLFSGVKSVGKGFAGAFGGVRCMNLSCCGDTTGSDEEKKERNHPRDIYQDIGLDND